MEDRFPHVRNLLKQFDLKSCGPRAASFLEPMEEVVVCDGVGEAEIDYHSHHLSHHLHGTYSAIAPPPSRIITTACQVASSDKTSP